MDEEELKQFVIEQRGEAYYHEHYVVMWDACMTHPLDYEPWGKQKRLGGGDCSCGCKWARELGGEHALDWVVCVNPNSHRVGLLTFEHQAGAECFEYDDEE